MTNQEFRLLMYLSLRNYVTRIYNRPYTQCVRIITLVLLLLLLFLFLIVLSSLLIKYSGLLTLNN
jgi:hypothetical protein